MTKQIRNLPALILFAWALVVTLSAAQAQEDEQFPVVRFACLAWDRFDAEPMLYQSGEEVEEVSISSSKRSETYTYRGPQPLVFFRTRTLADGTVERIPAASASIAEGMRDVLLLFIKHSNPRPGEPEFDVAVINDSTSFFPWGSYCVYNLSAYEIGGIIGSEKFTIEGKKSRVVKPTNENQVDVQIHFSQMVDGKWVPKMNTRWLYRTDTRKIVFVTDDQTSRRPRLKIKTIPQYQD